jgi:hypothetical protein
MILKVYFFIPFRAYDEALDGFFCLPLLESGKQSRRFLAGCT